MSVAHIRSNEKKCFIILKVLSLINSWVWANDGGVWGTWIEVMDCYFCGGFLLWSVRVGGEGLLRTVSKWPFQGPSVEGTTETR